MKMFTPINLELKLLVYFAIVVRCRAVDFYFALLQPLAYRAVLFPWSWHNCEEYLYLPIDRIINISHHNNIKNNRSKIDNSGQLKRCRFDWMNRPEKSQIEKWIIDNHIWFILIGMITITCKNNSTKQKCNY